MSRRSTGIIDVNGIELFEGDVVKYSWARHNTGSGGVREVKYHIMEKKTSGSWGISGCENNISDGQVIKEDLPNGCILLYGYEDKTKMPIGEYLYKYGSENYRRAVNKFNANMVKAMRESINAATI